MTPTQSPVIDVRTLEPRERHVQIFGKFDAMRAGEALQIVNDHDPVPLYYQFAAEWPGTFTWEHLLKEPTEVRVKITKIKPTETGAAETPTACGCSPA